jgi:2-dehydropantoate 2-reductase
MRVCIFGAGAVGGYLAAMLLKAGARVSVIARGAHLRAIASDGLTLQVGDQSFTVRPHAASHDAATLAQQDVVFVTTKTHAHAALAHDIGVLLGGAGAAVFVGNGIPWWWSFKGDAASRPLPLLDPNGALWSIVRPERAIGCVVYSANEIVQPGVVRHIANNRWLLGEPDGQHTPRLIGVVDLLRDAGLGAAIAGDLRREIWSKLLRNAPLNSICALTRLAVGELAADAGLVALCGTVVDEIAAVAAAHGADVQSQVAAAKEAPLRSGALDGTQSARILPSMLQDVLQGRPLELAPILEQVQLFAREASVETPTLDALFTLLRGLGRATLHECHA